MCQYVNTYQRVIHSSARCETLISGLKINKCLRTHRNQTDLTRKCTLLLLMWSDNVFRTLIIIFRPKLYEGWLCRSILSENMVELLMPFCRQLRMLVCLIIFYFFESLINQTGDLPESFVFEVIDGTKIILCLLFVGGVSASVWL